MTIDHVMAALGVGRAAAYRRISACIEACLVERFELLRLEPSLLRATSRGLAYAGLGLGKAMVSPGSLDHRLRCATTAQILAEEFDPAAVLAERELLLAERTGGRPIAGARLPGQHRLHRPDLAVLADGETIAIELELSPKGPRRLEPIIAAWQKADSISAVRYYVEPGPTRRGVERAVEKVGASGRIQILEAPRR